jgi:hypothetical protein
LISCNNNFRSSTPKGKLVSTNYNGPVMLSSN